MFDNLRGNMLREIAQIILSIHLSLAPSQHISDKTIENFATEIQKGADDAEVDPLLFVAIITHESQWNERAISEDKEDYGLMQIRARHYNSGTHSEWLLDAHNNIRAGTYVMKKDFEVCRKILKREPTLQEWLSAYQGARPSCKRNRMTKEVEDYFKCIIEKVEVKTGDESSTSCREIYWTTHPAGKTK